MQSIKDNLQDLKKCTVAIRNSIGDDVLGTGVIVTDDGLILTCYHVIEDQRNNTIYKTVHISFPSISSNSRIKTHAEVKEQYCNPSLDIAFLQLNEKKPDGIIAAELSEKTVSPTHSFIGFGFRKAREFNGLHSDGNIMGTTNKKLKDGNTSSPSLIQLESKKIAAGMSGSPILDTKINRIIGIVSERYRTQDDIDNDLSLGVPVESIIQVCPELKQKNHGLKPIFDFVRYIGQEGTRKYEKIDELYVPPTNYEDIKRSLEEDKILFLTGTREYGKTYTAVHLLWEYYKNKGYEPIWFKGANEKEERRDVRKKFANVEEYLKPHNIIYFEDPFGKTEYEVNVDEGIIRNIASIIETVENTEDTYAIITSREEVFKEFEHKIIAEVDLRKYEKKLSVKAPSYDYEKRKEMLLKWAGVMNCKWNEDEDLKNTIIDTIKDESKLPTPLNIEQFAISTATKKKLEKDELLEKINAKSIETARGFAQEIKMMSVGKVIFLSFPFISEHFIVDFVKENYQKLVKELENKEKQTAWEFDRILDWFKNDKIDVTYDVYVKRNVIRFSHPSYSEALPFLLLEDDDNDTQINIKFFFSTVLMKLADNKDGSRGVAFDVSNTVANNFDKLPVDARNELLIKLSDKKDAAHTVSNTVANNFDKLPENVQNLLFKIADNKETARFVAFAVGDNFDKLPENVQNLLFKIADNKDAVRDIVKFIASNFDKLSANVQNLLVKLADKEYLAASLSYAVASNFDELPEKVRNDLLMKLADKEYADVVNVVSKNFDKLHSEERNDLLMKLADNKDAAQGLARIVSDNFDKLPENTRNKLRKRIGKYGYAIYYKREGFRKYYKGIR
jgi:predicted transcriptional regulator